MKILTNITYMCNQIVTSSFTNWLRPMPVSTEKERGLAY